DVSKSGSLQDVAPWNSGIKLVDGMAVWHPRVVGAQESVRVKPMGYGPLIRWKVPIRDADESEAARREEESRLEGRNGGDLPAFQELARHPTSVSANGSPAAKGQVDQEVESQVMVGVIGRLALFKLQSRIQIGNSGLRGTEHRQVRSACGAEIRSVQSPLEN